MSRLKEGSRAAVLVAPGRLESAQLAVPPITDDGALLRVQACGICGTDLEQYQGEYRPVFPTIPGHEPLGVIVAIGERAQQRWGISTGDRVVVYPRFGCGRCEHCRREEFRHCAQVGIYGFTPTDRAPGLWGGYSEILYLAPGSKLRRVRHDIASEVAVQFNALGAGFAWAVNVPEIRPGDDVVVLGCGQRGLACVIAARESGARRVIVTGLARDTAKLALACELGADAAVDVQRDNPADVVAELTAGAGARIVVDTTPRAPGAVVDAVDMAAQGGTVVLAGLKGQRAVPELFSDRIVTKELTLKGVLGVDYRSLEQAMVLIESGRYPLDRLHTHSFGLERVDTALQTLAIGAAIHLAITP